jgi:hypothetical protein
LCKGRVPVATSCITDMSPVAAESPSGERRGG